MLSRPYVWTPVHGVLVWRKTRIKLQARSTCQWLLLYAEAKGNWEAELWPFDMIQSVINRSTA